MGAPFRTQQARTAAPSSIEAGGSNVEGISDSFARADHVHEIADPSTEVTASGVVTTTSTTFVTVAGMTITPSAGTYLVWFSANGEHNSGGGSELVVGLAVAGVDLAVTERQAGGGFLTANVRYAVSTQAKVTVNGSQAIEGRFRRDGGVGSVELDNRSLMIMKVGN